nr:hypothetical transcript [Hymenolepis microstoma]
MFFAHLLFTDSISWGVLECVKLNERDTSSSGRIFLKFLFQELCSFMGLAKLQARLRDETLQPFFVHLLPRNNPKDTRFAINFLITIGLGGLTIDLREHLQATKAAAEEKAKLAEDVENSSSDSGSESSSSSDSESSSSDSTSSTSSSGSSSNSSESESESSGSVEEPPLKRKRIEKRTRGHGPPDGDLNEVNKHPSDSLDDLRVKENGDRHDRHANKPESRRDGQVSLESGHGQRKGKRTTAPLSSGVQERRLDSPISPSLSRRVGGNGNDGNIRNASPPASVTNRSPAKANGRSKRREREPSRVLEERRRYNSPTPLQEKRKGVGPSSILQSRCSRYGDNRLDSPQPHRRGRQVSPPSVSVDSPPNVSRRRTPSPHRRNRYASPSPEAKEKLRKGRYDSPYKDLKRDGRRVDSRERGKRDGQGREASKGRKG